MLTAPAPWGIFAWGAAPWSVGFALDDTPAEPQATGNPSTIMLEGNARARALIGMGGMPGTQPRDGALIGAFRSRAWIGVTPD